MLIQCNKSVLLVELRGMKKQQCFSSLKKQDKQLLSFHKILEVSYKMEAQKIINLLNESNNKEFKF